MATLITKYKRIILISENEANLYIYYSLNTFLL